MLVYKLCISKIMNGIKRGRNFALLVSFKLSTVSKQNHISGVGRCSAFGGKGANSMLAVSETTFIFFITLSLFLHLCIFNIVDYCHNKRFRYIICLPVLKTKAKLKIFLIYHYFIFLVFFV